MKKFSKLTKHKINEEPKLDTKINEADILKSELLSLMDRYLHTKTHGSVDNRFMHGKVSIEGKNMLVEAIMDLLQKDDNVKKIQLLESLKSDIHDWKTLDRKISELESTDFNNHMLFENLINRYDEKSLIFVVESNIDKIKDKFFITERIKIIKNSNLNQITKDKLINIYNNKIIDLNGKKKS